MTGRGQPKSPRTHENAAAGEIPARQPQKHQLKNHLAQVVFQFWLKAIELIVCPKDDFISELNGGWVDGNTVRACLIGQVVKRIYQRSGDGVHRP